MSPQKKIDVSVTITSFDTQSMRIFRIYEKRNADEMKIVYDAAGGLLLDGTEMVSKLSTPIFPTTRESPKIF